MKNLPDPNSYWARVELFRWQYGELPLPSDKRKLNIVMGLKKMADAIESGNPENFPAPHNVVSVLRYAATELESYLKLFTERLNEQQENQHEQET